MSVPQHLAADIQNWERIHKQTVALIKTAPDDKYDWRTCPSAMTLGELLNHFNQAEAGLAHALLHGNFPAERPAAINNTAELVAAFADTHQAAVAQVCTLTPEQLTEMIAPFGPGRNMPRATLLRGMQEHEIHHRGQLYTYLRMLDVAMPPLFA